MNVCGVTMSDPHPSRCRQDRSLSCAARLMRLRRPLHAETRQARWQVSIGSARHSPNQLRRAPFSAGKNSSTGTAALRCTCLLPNVVRCMSGGAHPPAIRCAPRGPSPAAGCRRGARAPRRYCRRDSTTIEPAACCSAQIRYRVAPAPGIAAPPVQSSGRQSVATRR